MERIVLNVGLELGAISPALFTMFVLMAGRHDAGNDADSSWGRSRGCPGSAPLMRA